MDHGQATDGGVMEEQRAAPTPSSRQRPVLRAVVTDLDGVLTDTETVFLRAIDALLGEEGLATLGPGEARGLVGLDNASIWRQLCDLKLLRLSLADYTVRVDRMARALFERELVPAPGAVQFLQGVRVRGLPLGLATSAERDWVQHRLELLGLTDAFDVIVTGDQVQRHKPDPEIYLTATAALGVRPSESLGIEDSLSGVRSARAAGLYTVAVRTIWTTHLDLSHAHETVGSLLEIDLDKLMALQRWADGQQGASTR